MLETSRILNYKLFSETPSHEFYEKILFYTATFISIQKKKIIAEVKVVNMKIDLHVDEPRAGSHALILIALRLVHLGLELKINYHTGFNNARTGWITAEINKINID